MSRPRLLTVFQNFPFSQQMLYKDVGAIPYYLSVLFGYEASLAYFPPKGMSIIDDEFASKVRLVRLGVFRHRLANTLRAVWFFLREAGKFDVLTVFHDSLYSILLAATYKALRPSGVTYIKLDMSHLELGPGEKDRPALSIRRFLRFMISRKAVDIYTVEAKDIYDALRDDYYFRGRIHYLPNGFHCAEDMDVDSVLREKENIILTVGRIGTFQKHNELLIEALSRLDEEALSGWKVHLVGPMEDGFRQYLSDAMNKHPHLKGVVVLRGPVYDREEIYKIYGKARVFCLTSRWESFGLVMSEAMYFGDYLIASELPSSRDLTANGMVGALFPAGDVQALSEILTKAISGETDLDSYGRKAHELVVKEFNWKVIAGMLDSLLRKAAS